MKNPIAIVKLREGVVEEANLFSNAQDAEEKFTLEALDLGAKKDDIESHIEDGYYEGKYLTVCLVTLDVSQREPDPNITLSLSERIERAWDSNPMWDLALELHKEGYTETSLQSDENINSSAVQTLRNYLRDISKNNPKPKRL